MNRRREFPKQQKSLGQVFLSTDWPVTRVVSKMESWKAQRVLEIGPGAGILTKALLNDNLLVTAVEKDDRFVERLIDFNLTREASSPGKLEVINQDILKFDLEAWMKKSAEPCAVVGNIPYNISSPIIMWLLPHINKLVGANLMVQLEFAQRLVSHPNSKSFGSLSVYAQLRANIEMDCKVDRACFHPVPKVDSALINFRSRNREIPESTLLKVEKITRSAFNQRRKKLRNAISSFISEDHIAGCPIDLNRRPDALRPDEYVELANYCFADK